MTQLISGANVSVHEFVWNEDLWAFNLTPLTHMLFCICCLLILWTLSKCYCVKCSSISQISVSDLSQGSAVTHLRCDGQCDMDFVANFWENKTVKELWKSVNICQSYKWMYSGTVFLTHCVYTGYILYMRIDLSVRVSNVNSISSQMYPNKHIISWICWTAELRYDEGGRCGGWEWQGKVKRVSERRKQQRSQEPRWEGGGHSQR